MSDTDDVRRAFERCRTRDEPLDALAVGFLLGYQFGEQGGHAVAFDVGGEGPLEAAFDPTVDLLVTSDQPEGFVTVGADEEGLASVEEVRAALGRALALLGVPTTETGGALARVSVAGPLTEGGSVADIGSLEDEDLEEIDPHEIRLGGVVDACRASPIGLVNVTRSGVETLVAPTPNPHFVPGLAEVTVDGVTGGGTTAEAPPDLRERASELLDEGAEETA